MTGGTYVKKSYAAIAASLAMLGVSGTAIGQGPVTVTAFQPAQAGGGCAYFQVKGDPTGQWYSMAVSDPSFNSQFGFVMSVFYSGTPITFATSGTACTYPRVVWMYAGTLN
jgi:hypothetical protein